LLADAVEEELEAVSEPLRGIGGERARRNRTDVTACEQRGRSSWSSRGAGALYERADRVAEEVVGNGVGVGEEFDREAVAERD
jgi:hypothetical protein